MDFLQKFDVHDFITSYIAKKTLDNAFIGIKHAIKIINKTKNKITFKEFDESQTIEFISQHLLENKKWASNISFRDSIKSKNTEDIFVELELYITPIKLRLQTEETVPSISIKKLLSDTEKNIILLGQPGAGKTTSIKKIFLETLKKEDDYLKIFNFPIVVRLKELPFEDENTNFILFKEIFNTLGIFYSFEGELGKIEQEKILCHLFKDFIERLDVLIILDGFDEIGNKKIRENIIRNLRLITNSMVSSRFILTSRSADYDAFIENSKEYEICPLKEKQIEIFIYNWLNNEKESKLLLSQLKKSPYWDTTMRPLTLAHLCALYERNKAIPDKPKSIYKKIILLLLEEWNTQRGIKRVSKYSKFEVDRKMDFLSKFAYILTIEYQLTSFSDYILSSIFNAICLDFELPKDDCHLVINEIESHNGLILQTGHDDFAFAHKSLQEYLVADYLVKLPRLMIDTEILLSIPNELAVLLSISSTPNLTYFELIFNILQEEVLSKSFLLAFCSRLLTERPDFESNFLFVITNAYLINKIASKIAILRDPDENIAILNDDEWDFNGIIKRNFNLFEEEEDDDDENDLNNPEIKYYEECLEMILSYNSSMVSEKSFRDVANYYYLSNITLSKKK